MRKYSIGSRYIALLLLVAMLFGMVPVMDLTASAEGAEKGELKYMTLTEDGVVLKTDGKDTITMPIRINNFLNDGMMFEYLSSAYNRRDSAFYQFEEKGYYQLYPFALDSDRTLGVDRFDKGVYDPEYGMISNATGTTDANGISDGLNLSGTLDDADNYVVNSSVGNDTGVYDDDYYGTRSSMPNTTRTIWSSMAPEKVTDKGTTAFMRLKPDGSTHTSNNSNRAWRKITSFNTAVKVDDIRYAVIIYRIQKNADVGKTVNDAGRTAITYANGTNGNDDNVNTAGYDTMLFTVNYFDEVSTAGSQNKSTTVKVDLSNSGEWTYAIIDMVRTDNEGNRNSDAIPANTNIKDIYLRSALHYTDTGLRMDIAGVGYFPYYGDAEQFANYGLTLGCTQYHIARNNSSFSFRAANTTSVPKDDGTKYNRDGAKYEQETGVESVPNWIAANYVSTNPDYNGSRPFTFANSNVTLDMFTKVTTASNVTTTIDTITEIGYALFGEVDGDASVGLLESALDENGRPQYKKSVINYMAAFLRNRLVGQTEFPDSNYGWKSYNFVTGVSTSSEKNEARFGFDSLGRPMDLASAICAQLHVNKGTGNEAQAEYKDYNSKDDAAVKAVYGSYNDTMDHKDELIGPWNEVKGNIKTWYDAAYYILHNLFVTEDDVAYDNDGYGEYEDNYTNFVLPQAEITDENGDTRTAYFFDSGYSKSNGSTAISNVDKWTSAVLYKNGLNNKNGTITLDTSADGKALFADDSSTAEKASYANIFPFLPTSGNNDKGESNSPYYLHDGVISDGTRLWTYKNRDYHFTMSGNGYFGYERDLYFEFDGDDDVYVFINGQLVVDLGGTHGATYAHMYLDDYVDWAWSVKNNEEEYKGKTYAQLTGDDKARVDALALEEGGIYSFDFFYMERHGVGSNLKIMTNIEITADGLDVDKQAWQMNEDGVQEEIEDNEIANVDEMIEYGFTITNNSDTKLYNLEISDPVIGVLMSYDATKTYSDDNGDPNGLIYKSNNVTDAAGDRLNITDLQIKKNGVPVGNITGYSSLRTFLGTGLEPGQTLEIRGIYYTLTDTQKAYTSFRNYVVAQGDVGDHILRGSANHTIYQPGNPAYYQWLTHAIIIESERLYNDLIVGGVVTGPADLPAVGNMVLIPSNAAGTKYQSGHLSGGDVYLKVDYPETGTYMDYVTILDATDPEYKLTVPITIYVADAPESVFVLDYGLDTYLTENNAIFDFELGLGMSDNVTGTVMGIADSDDGAEYLPYDTDYLDETDPTIVGNTENELTLLEGSYSNGAHTDARYKLDSAIYLDHSKPWVIEWKASTPVTKDTMLFSKTELSDIDGNVYLFLDYNENGTARVSMGRYSTDAKFANVPTKTITELTAEGEHTFKLYNVPGINDTNTVYVQVDNNTIYQLTPDVDSISGLDFEFNYMGAKYGTNTSHRINQTLKYIHVYEDGEGQFTHYNWAGSDLTTTDTEKVGYVANTATLKSTTSEPSYWELDKPAVLNHDVPWEISFKAKIGESTMILSSDATNERYSTNVYLSGSRVHMGLAEYADVGNGERNRFIEFGIDVAASNKISGYDQDANEYTYILRNHVNPDGSNEVYLYILDGTTEVEIGALDTRYIGGVIYETAICEYTSLSGLDFVFNYIGVQGDFGLNTANSTLKDLQIRSRTTLTTAYEWKVDSNGDFVNVNYTSDGNRINFTKDDDGVVEVEDGVFTLYSDKLKFEATDFMDSIYSAYIAMTLHENDFVPTPLGDRGVEVGHEVQMYKQITVLPANVVYYEDDFPAIHYIKEEGTNANTFTQIGNGSGSGTNTEADQNGSALTQSPDQDTEYGSDETYSDSFSGMSGDSLHKIAINKTGPIAWFAFTGTGFEIEARTNAIDTGMIYLEVYNKTDVTIDGDNMTVNDGAESIDWILVNPEFDLSNNDGAETIYQIPVIRWYKSNLQPSDYVVVINGMAMYDYRAEPVNNQYPLIETYLYLDGIRIYRPLGYTDSNYGDEDVIAFNEIRDYIIDGKFLVCDYSEEDGIQASTGTVSWTEKYNHRDYAGTSYEGHKVNSINDYVMDGPNNEVYVDGTFTSGAIAFYVRESTAEDYKDYVKELQIAARAIDAGLYYGAGSTGLKANLQLGVWDGDSVAWIHLATVSSGTEQYYSIPFTNCPTVQLSDGKTYYQVVIRVTSFSEEIPAMVSFTGLKRTNGLYMSDAVFDLPNIELNEETGEWYIPSTEVETAEYSVMSLLSRQLSSNKVITLDDLNEGAPGDDFEIEEPIPEDVPAIIPQYPTLSFEGEVRYNIYYTLQNLGDVALEDMGLITFDSKLYDGTIADAVDVIPGAVSKNGEYMVHTNGIPAKNMGDMVYFKVYAKLADGSYVYSDLNGYNAVYYAESFLNNSTNEEMQALVVAMLNYGAEAQKFFGYKTDSLMNAGLTAEQQAKVAAYSSDLVDDIVFADSGKAGAFAATGGFSNMYPTVSFDGAFAINYYFTPDRVMDGDMTMYYWDMETYNSVSELTAANATGSQTMVAAPTAGEYGARYTGMAAKEIGETVYVAVVYESNGVTYCSGVISYSLAYYCQAHAEYESSAMKDLAAATAVYGYYAKNYFAN